MTEIKTNNQVNVGHTLVKASWRIRLLPEISSPGDRTTTGGTIIALERGGLNPDLAVSGLASGRGVRVLVGYRENRLPERDPSQPISTLEEHEDTLVHTRELIDGNRSMRKFIVNVVTARDAASIGLGDLVQEQSDENSIIQFPKGADVKSAA